jgi:hypothetical protein
VLITGIDTDHSKTVGWFSTGDPVMADAKRAHELSRYYAIHGCEPVGWTWTGYEYQWRLTGQFFLTKVAADAFVGSSDKYRVHVNFACRNHELKEVRRLMAGLLAQCVEALQLADQFITNGIGLGYIRMPDADIQDQAHTIPGAVKAALSLPNTDKEPHKSGARTKKLCHR